MDIEAIQKLLEEILNRELTGEEGEHLRGLKAEGKIALSAGECSVSVTGDVAGGINTGDQHTHLHLSMKDFPEAWQRLERVLYEPQELPEKGLLPPIGVLPPGSHIPHVRNADFTGRSEDLLALAEYLLYAPDTGAVRVYQAAAAATGMGGLGKT